MRPMDASQADFLLQAVILPALKNEHRITRSIIEAIPVDKGDYTPDTISKSALDLAWHIAVTEMRFMEAVRAGGFDLSPRPRPESIRDSAALATWYAENFSSHFETLAKLSPDELLKAVDFRGILQLPAVIYLNVLMHHSIHHRGQLTTYLRPMGAKVPSIYGESHDATQARMAAEQTA